MMAGFIPLGRPLSRALPSCRTRRAMPPDASNPLAASLEHVDELSDILTQWLGAAVTLTPGQPGAYLAEEPPEALNQGPWLAIAIGEAETGLLAVISESVLPAGALEPDDDQYRGLVEVARGVAQVVASEAADAGQFRPGTVRDLTAEIAKAGLSEATQVLIFSLACQGDENQKEGTLILIGPVSSPLALVPERVLEPSPQSEPAANEAAEPSPGPPQGGDAGTVVSALMKVPVPVAVTLAEKSMPLGNVLDLGPGMIIQFEKSCDELLDLKVNWRSIGKGEAMKVGEKFGIKITEIFSPEERAALLG